MTENILTLADLQKCSGALVTVDVETTGLAWYNDVIIGVGVNCPEQNIFGYLPTLDEDSRRDACEVIGAWSPETQFIAHNVKFELHFLKIDPFKTGWQLHDTAVMVHLLDSRTKKKLDTVEEIFLGTTTKRDLVDAAPVRLKNKIWEWPFDLTVKYCCNDVRIEHEIFVELLPRIKQWSLWELYLKDMEYIKALWRMEHHGVLIDPEFFLTSMEKQATTLERLEQTMYDSVGYEFNWRSHKQLSDAIYGNLGIEKPKNPFADADGVDRSKFADAGLYKSTCTATFLLTEKVKHPLGTLVGALRESQRMRSTMKKYLELAGCENTVHTNLNLTGTRTGRLSSSKPNMQNVPSDHRGRFTQSVFTGSVDRTEEYNLRSGFKARPGKTFLAIDYKQMEMRMFGILSEDPFMLNSLRHGLDIHAEISERVWGVRDKVHREWSKTISFGLIYGMTIGSLMFKLNMSPQEARSVCNDYWKTFPRIQPWLNERIALCKQDGYLRYWSNRLWKEENPRFMYKGANAQIQGGCADIFSIATIRADRWLRQQSPEHIVVMPVHDELIMEVPSDDVLRCVPILSDIMEVCDLFDIPFVTTAKLGNSYGTLVKMGDKEEHYL